MSSWPAPPPAYPPAPGRRESRSRSPRRRDTAYHDPATVYPPPGDPYREPHDWSGYDHRRAWDEYYDRRGRGRSRSPVGEDASRKRRRSASPYERDRFDPRPRYVDDYDAHSRAYGYSSPRRTSHPGAYPPPAGGPTRFGRVPPDPYTMEPNPATLRQFADWFRFHFAKEAKEDDDADRAAEKEAGKKTRDGIRARWEKYKKEHLANQIQTMFQHHKKSPWFSEKYNPAPEWINLRARVRKEGWKGRPEQFLKDLEDGKFDPKVDQESSASVATEEVAVKSEAKADDMDAVEDGHENGSESPAKSETNGKNTYQGRPPRDDDVALEPEGNQMAIRTIPPDIGRQKIEEACRSVPGFVHLALGDPLQKRHYYRAGWMKFADDADMQKAVLLVGEKKIDGFKLHVNHLTRPYNVRLRQAPEVANTPERVEKDLLQIKQLAATLEDEYAALRQFKDDAPEPKVEDKKFNGHDGEQGGDAAMTDDDAHAANGAASEHEQPEVKSESESEPLDKGSEAVERRVEKLVAELQVQQDIAEGDGTESILDTKKSVIALDLYLAYLRNSFNTCYYCAAVCDHVEELHRKCPKHVRKPLQEKSSPAAAPENVEMKVEEDKDKARDKEKEREAKDRNERRWERNDERWAEWVDSKVALLINRAGIDPIEYGGKNYDDELTKAVEPHIRQEDEGKFRCRTCNKLFKATAFIEKHIANKHPDLMPELNELPFFNNFALDPQRIQPFSHLPPPIGNSTLPPPQAYGLPGSMGPYSAPDYSRPMQSGYGTYPPHAFPPYANGAPPHFDYHQPAHWPAPVRRDEVPPPAGRRLQERVGGYAQTTPLTLTGVEGLPPKPMATLEPGPGARRGRAATGPPPPPPPDAKEDPRAASGRKVSYHDMDDVAEGDVELMY